MSRTAACVSQSVDAFPKPAAKPAMQPSVFIEAAWGGLEMYNYSGLLLCCLPVPQSVVDISSGT